ncbi:PPK2 family polyphosphate kinase [Staphylococcus canis]|uniref:Polyphosphate--nucleotide phosphotransferase n=1 Tax=Staphylococcus canis TaxID=2724942 RepID=A0ABS0TAQ8_9STAP|nr:PPK2 family polyphosphate kinase [Staphylococcus canis]MBI5975051.1 polyphosphate--nucleotide phosphotransferase [Staphylococcus canis]
MKINLNEFKYTGQEAFHFNDYPYYKDIDIDETTIQNEVIPELVEELKTLHLKLFAEEKKGVVVVLQAMDAAGKDEAISYIFSNLNAQGLNTASFGKPSEEEAKHDFMWRLYQDLPARGEFSLLNRSYYEEVIVTRVHDLLDDTEHNAIDDENIWKMRHRHIREHEQYLVENGFHVIKFFFNMSKSTQKERLLERMENPEKHWEFSFNDVEEREHWDTYQDVFEDMLTHTATDYAPWYVLPADNPWYSRAIVSSVMIEVLKSINPQFPSFSEEDQKTLNEYITKLKNEADE